MEKESSDNEHEERIMAVGNRLHKAPRTANDLLPLLDELENLLIGVEQSPSESMLSALDPAMKALVLRDILEITDTNVHVSVTTCISEITRITAPEAPYDDDLMKEIFHRIVQSFQNLDDLSSNLHPKRVSILETVAKVRSCVVMLDLECDSLILDMFHHFLETIRESHSENVVSSMETVMSLVLEESEEISPELISLLLLTVKIDNKRILPAARTLVERVMANCAEKLKPSLLEAVKSIGAPLTDYSKIVATICQEGTDALGHGNNAEVNEKKVVEGAVTGEAEQVSSKTLPDALDVAEVATKALENNGKTLPGDDSSSEKKSQHAHNVMQLREEEKNTLDHTVKRRRGRPSIRKEEVKLPVRGRGRGRGPSAVASKQIPKEESQGEKLDKSAENVASLESSRRKRGRSSGFKGSIKRQRSEVSTNGDAAQKIDEDVDDLEKKPLKDFAKRLLGDGQIGGGTPRKARSKISKDSPIIGSEDKLQKKRGRKPKKSLEDSLEKPMDDKSGNVSNLKETVGELEVTPEADKGQTISGESSQKKRQKKQVPEEASKMVHRIKYDESLVGVKIKVWWPDDKKFYAGIVQSYNPTTRKHKVLYNDGDEENLLLKKETIKFRKGTKLGMEEKIASTSDVTPETSLKKQESSGRKSKSNATPSDVAGEVKAAELTDSGVNRRGRHSKSRDGNTESEPRKRGTKSGATTSTKSVESSRRHGRRLKDTTVTVDDGAAGANNVLRAHDMDAMDGDEDGTPKKEIVIEKIQSEVNSGETASLGAVEDSAKRRKK